MGIQSPLTSTSSFWVRSLIAEFTLRLVGTQASAIKEAPEYHELVLVTMHFSLLHNFSLLMR